jgi:Mn2+/Fe2+ NRAMP family transporter
LLLLRNAAAYYLFIASLIGVIVTMTHVLGITGSTIGFSPFEIFMMIIMPVVVAVFLILYSLLALRKGWIKKE